MKFPCPTCSELLLCDDSHGGERILCPKCYAAFIVPPPPFRLGMWVFFVGWVLVGVVGLFWYAGHLWQGKVAIYALNGHDRPVVVFYQKKKVARLLPDQTQLIKLRSTGGLLEVDPAEAVGGTMGQLDKGTYLLNFGTGYWVSRRHLEYTSNYSTSANQSIKYEQSGLVHISDLVYSPWEVSEFGETPPGSVSSSEESPDISFKCGSSSGRHVLPYSGSMGPLALDKKWGFWGVALPGAVIAFVWLVGFLMLIPEQLKRLIRPNNHNASK